ncbi:hypothetical protein IG631_23344 [Alternaria alternata]|nr:hypothetical protein IG631_23344 [Alternaria alternata]
MRASQETRPPTRLPRKPPDGGRTAAASSQQTHPHSYTHSGRRLEGGAIRRQRERGSARGGKTRKAARHTGTRRRPPRKCCSSTRGLARGRVLCWCSCGPRRLDLKTFSSIDTSRPSPVPAAAVERGDRPSPTSSSTAASTRTSGTPSSPTHPDDIASGQS